MEELNDVEFGSDKSSEEAPILVAQRYLNIFRQIHVFNKAKREQFDEELLALPQNIIETVTRMPGGRLLIEHIEEVKTARGISFIRTRNDEFSNNATTLPAGNTSGTNINAGGNYISADFSQFFELLTQEINMSKKSLTDVLLETRKLTEAVIASQNILAKLLEQVLTKGNSISVSPVKNSDNISAKDNFSQPTSGESHNKADIHTHPADTGEMKKKKKNKNRVPFQGQQPVIKQETLNTEQIDNSNSSPEKSANLMSTLGGIIRNVAFKHEDTFDNINLDEPPLEDTPINNSVSEGIENLDFTDIPEDFESADDDLDFTLPDETYVVEKENILDNNNQEELIQSFTTNSDDDLDFTLPKTPDSSSVPSPEISTVAEETLDNISVVDSNNLSLNPEATTNSIIQESVEPTHLTNNDITPEIDSIIKESIEPTAIVNNDNISLTVDEDETVSNTEQVALQESVLNQPDQEDSEDSLNNLLGSVNFDMPEEEVAEQTPVSLDIKEQPVSVPQPNTSRYSAELDKIREALTSDSVDLSSLDTPIALDDYSDDENVGQNDYFEQPSKPAAPNASITDTIEQPDSTANEEWDWEYVDENGNPIEGGDDGDWEWEYVEDDGSETSTDNS